MGSNLANTAIPCNHVMRQYTQEIFLAEYQVNDWPCVLLQYLVETTHFFIHTREKIVQFQPIKTFKPFIIGSRRLSMNRV